MPRKPKLKRPFSLTNKELDVATLLAYGYSQFEVARGLGISHNTVRETAQRIYRKTSATSLVVAAIKLERAGLLSHVNYDLVEKDTQDEHHS